MARTTQVQIKTPTAVYAVVGAGDLVVERIRAVRVEREVEALQMQVLNLPVAAQARVQAGVNAALGQASEAYGDLARRGETLVTRIRGQKSTQEASTAVRTTTSRAKATTTTAKKAARETTTRAKATTTTARKAAKETSTRAKATSTTAQRAAGTTAKAAGDAARKIGD